MRPKVVMSLVLSLAPGPASVPGFIDAPKLAEICAAEAPDGKAICMGYVAGVLDQVISYQARLPRARRTICLPADMTVNRAVDAVQASADWAKTSEGVGASGFVKYALERAYPCEAQTESHAVPVAERRLKAR